MNILKKIFNRPTIPEFSGVRDDPRPQEEKDKDHEVKEVVAMAEDVVWEEKPRDEWLRFEPVKSQGRSSSCGGQAGALSLGIENYYEEGKHLDLSPKFIYKRRKNYPDAGMYFHDLLDLCSNVGSTFEVSMPSRDMSEDEMNNFDQETNSDEMVAEIFKADGYAVTSGYDHNFDHMAKAIDDKDSIILLVRFESGEFRKPEIRSTKNGPLGHFVVGVDRTIYKGKKAIVVANSWDDDWGWDGYGILTEDNAQGIYGWGLLYDRDNSFDGEKDESMKPSYTFTEPIEYGDRNDTVAKLQECLKWEEVFPQSVACTGYFGEITRKAVRKFQFKHMVASTEELEAVDGKRVGPLTRKKLNEIFE